jgi:hypothetical protein
MNRYVVDDSTEGRLWGQAANAIGPLNKIKDWIPIRLNPTELEAQYMEWVQNVVRMQRQCRFGVFSRFAFRDMDTRMEIDLLITIDGRRLDPKMRLLPPSIRSHGFPTFRNMFELNMSGLFHIPAGVFADAWKLKVRRTMDLRFVNHQEMEELRAEFADLESRYVFQGPTLELDEDTPIELLFKMAQLNCSFELCQRARALLGVPEPRNYDPLTEKHRNDLFSMRSLFDPKIRERIVLLNLRELRATAARPAARPAQRPTAWPTRDCDPELERQKDRRREQGLPV